MNYAAVSCCCPCTVILFRIKKLGLLVTNNRPRQQKTDELCNSVNCNKEEREGLGETLTFHSKQRDHQKDRPCRKCAHVWNSSVRCWIDTGSEASDTITLHCNHKSTYILSVSLVAAIEQFFVSLIYKKYLFLASPVRQWQTVCCNWTQKSAVRIWRCALVEKRRGGRLAQQHKPQRGGIIRYNGGVGRFLSVITDADRHTDTVVI